MYSNNGKVSPGYRIIIEMALSAKQNHESKKHETLHKKHGL